MNDFHHNGTTLYRLPLRKLFYGHVACMIGTACFVLYALASIPNINRVLLNAMAVPIVLSMVLFPSLIALAVSRTPRFSREKSLNILSSDAGLSIAQAIFLVLPFVCSVP